MIKRIRWISATILIVVILFTILLLNDYASSVTLDPLSDISIGITYNPSPTNYVKCIEQTGAKALVLPLITSSEEAREVLSGIDALVIAGGPDIDPSYYGVEASDKLEKGSPERDISDLLMIEEAVKINMPVLGICRGLQAINVALGGTLYQDIPTEYKETNQEVVHRDPNKKVIVYHDISIVNNSLLYDIIGSKALNVTSFHHQAIKDLGKGLSVAARTEDGIIEAIESVDEKYIVGVQFHPEKHAVSNNWEQMELFKDLKVRGLMYRSTLVPSLSAPKNVKATLYGHDDVKISWNKVKNATAYAVYYKKSTSSSYTLLGRTINLSIKKADLTDGVKYYFKVVPYYKSGENRYYSVNNKTTNIYTLKR